MKHTPKKVMKEELEKFRDSVYMLNKIGGLNKIELPSLDYYNHLNAELHHFIKYSDYVQDPKWYEEHNIQQKLILLPKLCHEHIHDIGNVSDSAFQRKWQISRWKLLFNRKHTEY